MLISIIIPFYNCEGYLKECLDSVKACLINDIEFILVNDGSNDMSEDICREYVNIDSRFILISKENTGVSDSRNIGVEYAKGEFIFFLDADDYIKTDMWNIITHQAQSEYDMIAFAYNSLYEHGNTKIELYNIPNDFTETENDEHINYNLLATPMLNSCWGKLLKRQIITDNNLKFDTTLKTCEDAIFIIDFIQASNRHRIINTSVLYYRINKQSVMNTTDIINKLHDFNKLYLRRNKYCSSLDYNEVLYKALYRYYFSAVTDLMIKQAMKINILSLYYSYNEILSTSPVDNIILNVEYSSLSPYFKKIEHIFMKYQLTALLALYFKIKSCFSRVIQI